VFQANVSATDLDNEIDDYLSAGIQIAWIVNPDRHTIQVYWSDGRTRLFRDGEWIDLEPLLLKSRLFDSEYFR